jgi:hypothetical protein
MDEPFHHGFLENIFRILAIPGHSENPSKYLWVPEILAR